MDKKEGLIRYIGQTKHIETRYSVHLANKHPKDILTPVGQWIHWLKDKNEEPCIIVLDYVPDDSAEEMESAWIKHFENLGCKLLNKKRKLNAKTRNPVS